jgi:hypothetical protein
LTRFYKIRLVRGGQYQPWSTRLVGHHALADQGRTSSLTDGHDALYQLASGATIKKTFVIFVNGVLMEPTAPFPVMNT